MVIWVGEDNCSSSVGVGGMCGLAQAADMPETQLPLRARKSEPALSTPAAAAYLRGDSRLRLREGISGAESSPRFAHPGHQQSGQWGTGGIGSLWN